MDDSERKYLKNKLEMGLNQESQQGSAKRTKTATKSQINRLKVNLLMTTLQNFYYTTKWLPNSAFTTYFGKPAFENYGYGNIKPANGN